MKKITKEWLLANGFKFEYEDDCDWCLYREFDELLIAYESDFSVSISDSYKSYDKGYAITPNLPYLSHQEELIQFLALLGHEL